MNRPKASQFLNLEGLHITAKSLFYNCDLKAKWHGESLLASGRLRLGPLSTNVKIESQFDNQGLWKSFQIKASLKNFFQLYTWDPLNQAVIFTSSSSKEPLRLPNREDVFYDPFLVLVSVFSLVTSKQELPETYETFSGPKWTTLSQVQGQFFRNDKNIFTIIKDKTLVIEIQQLRAKLQVEGKLT